MSSFVRLAELAPLEVGLSFRIAVLAVCYPITLPARAVDHLLAKLVGFVEYAGANAPELF